MAELVPKRRLHPLSEKSFLIALSEEDRIRARIKIQGSEPVEIMIQLECWIDDKWRNVRRYDTSHGYLHVHLRPWDKPRDKRRRLTGGLKEALQIAIEDLKSNWQQYREVCVTATVEG